MYSYIALRELVALLSLSPDRKRNTTEKTLPLKSARLQRLPARLSLPLNEPSEVRAVVAWALASRQLVRNRKPVKPTRLLTLS